MNRPLRDDQIAFALERHGLPETTEILGIHYEADPNGAHPRVTITIRAAIGAKVLLVPDDVFALPAPLPGKRQHLRLFD